MELEKVLEGIGIPVKYYEYAGVKPEYIVYNEEVEQPADYGDNDPECHITWWQVHIFTPKTGKFREYKKATEAALRKAGFTVTDIRTLYETETKTIHVVLSCHEEREE